MDYMFGFEDECEGEDDGLFLILVLTPMGLLEIDLDSAEYLIDRGARFVPVLLGGATIVALALPTADGAEPIAFRCNKRPIWN